MKKNITVSKVSLRKQLSKIVHIHSGTNMFMVLEDTKINLWNVIFHRKQLLDKINNNYIILANDKYMLVKELGDLVNNKK